MSTQMLDTLTPPGSGTGLGTPGLSSLPITGATAGTASSVPYSSAADLGNAVVVIGAGIVGLSTALFLRRSGVPVVVYDALPPGGGTSFGNAGLISVDSCIPIATPGMLRKVPGWLTDPTGPLTVNPRYFPTAFPWLMRWIKAGQPVPMNTAANALRLLHEHALVHYRELLGEALFADLIRVTGQVHIWQNAAPSASEQAGQEIRRRFGINTPELSMGELQDLIPGISSNVKRAVLFPRNGNVINPLRLVQSIAKLFLEAGGTIRHERVMKLVPLGAGRYRMMTNLGDVNASRVVVAAGAWSKRLLAPLGIAIPLDTERGYHIELKAPSFDLKIPILHKDKGFGVTPMETGLRCAGTVEIAGLDLPPNEQRADAILRNTQLLFPKLEIGEKTTWMGFRPSMPDSVPVLGEAPAHPNLFIACGHGHTGITAGAISGRLVSQLVLKEAPVISPTPFSLQRFA